MKKGIVIGILLCLCLGAATPKFWQGVLHSPTSEWAGQYGTKDVSYLAYNCWVLRQQLDAQGKVVGEMKKELDKLKLKDLKEQE